MKRQTTSLQRLLRAVALHGATLTRGYEGEGYVVRVEAPTSFHWVEGYVHELVEDAGHGSGNRAALYGACCARMAYGTQPCDAACEWEDKS